MPKSDWYTSSIGKKALMALSGLILLGFVIMHLLGNLLIFLGPNALNAYAVKLRHFGPWLWVARSLLLAAVVIHSITSIQLARENRAARPVRYRVYRPAVSGYAARTMMLSGVLVLAYIIYHLLHFTFRVTNPEISHGVDALGRRDVYSMVVLSFQQPLIFAIYVLGVGLLCLHLSHGIGSTCQSLGINRERTIARANQLGQAIALLLFLGYVSIPLAVLMGRVTIPRVF